MTDEEYKGWQKEQMKDAGHWKVDLIHNTPEDFLAYVAEPEDPTRGIYVNIRSGVLECGRFENAMPHMGEALYKAITVIENEDPWKVAIERLGLSFLLAVTMGTSPYRVVA